MNVRRKERKERKAEAKAEVKAGRLNKGVRVEYRDGWMGTILKTIRDWDKEPVAVAIQRGERPGSYYVAQITSLEEK